ncbi:amidohydrolase : Amidohydrolase OS=Isosphaera pallida (strain ATCC 43644 / DSM 9630 / IS1B) GN=Isop_1172 PE=4 SV=1: Amidohydro_1 [Gemmata massiliana]|uniref:Amidohydrolase-related domain-containing protein n=1 Tax=Gemmata massiliana TaxID=1210884 RepID=A0A6P2DEM1_9BACT|nr:amidohydrolase family protein [Gemmata massiliana]VTR99144.1 amidohydrolase : Amidohydrolase OS=Isosphaera pallida (strain ATCC 43644 / DSM 9630 / IS1B) GN=Isop_1172 PE=4 SV=1: Amidohydro_1 [Gemmata massiliana]
MSERTEPRTFTARWVFSVSGPPLPNGTVTVRGEHIEAVLPHGARTPDEDVGNAAIIPGLVNPHTHLDLSGARGQIPPTDADHFTDWLRGVIGYRRTRTPEQTQSDTRTGLAECLRHGTTLIGDIASEGASWDALAGAPTRATVFREFIGLGSERAAVAMTTAEAITKSLPQTPNCRVGFSPHAPYSVHHALLAKVTELARLHRLPVAVHLAESPGEIELLQRHSGPFRTFLQNLGIWHADALSKSPDAWITRRLRRAPDLYIHANYLTPTPRIPKNGSIVYCPRTHAAFGHAPHPFREFLARSVRVCLGTDSLASNPDLDVLSEARFVRAGHPDFPGDQLLRMVTLSGAEALGWADETGTLGAGKSADLVVVPLPNADTRDPHELVLAEHAGDRRTMFRGAWRTATRAREGAEP